MHSVFGVLDEFLVLFGNQNIIFATENHLCTVKVHFLIKAQDEVYHRCIAFDPNREREPFHLAVDHPSDDGVPLHFKVSATVVQKDDTFGHQLLWGLGYLGCAESVFDVVHFLV